MPKAPRTTPVTAAIESPAGARRRRAAARPCTGRGRRRARLRRRSPRRSARPPSGWRGRGRRASRTSRGRGSPPRSRRPACRARRRRRDRADAGGDDERAVPAEGVVGEARDHRAEHLPGDDREQHPADHHLALAHVVGVAEAGEHERDQAAGEDAGDRSAVASRRREAVGAKAPSSEHHARARRRRPGCSAACRSGRRSGRGTAAPARRAARRRC